MLIVTYPTSIWHPRWGWPRWSFAISLALEN